MRRPGDEDPLGVAVLLGRIDAPAGRFVTAGFVDQLNGSGIAAQRGKDQLAVLAQPSLDEVAAVIVLRHPHGAPNHSDLIALTRGANALRRFVEVGKRQARIGLRHAEDIALDLEQVGLDPTVIGETLGVHINPSAGLVASLDLDAIIGIQAILVEVGGARPVAAVGLLQHDAGGVGEGGREAGREGDGGGERNGGRVDGCGRERDGDGEIHQAGDLNLAGDFDGVHDSGQLGNRRRSAGGGEQQQTQGLENGFFGTHHTIFLSRQIMRTTIPKSII